MVQQTQPVARVMTCTGSSPSNWVSVPASVDSVSITGIFRPSSAFNRWRSKVVLPAPRKPLSTVTGIGEDNIDPLHKIDEQHKTNVGAGLLAKGWGESRDMGYVTTVVG